MSWTPITPPGMKPPAAPYSLGATSTDGWVFTAGLVAIDEAGATVGAGDVRVQTRHVLASAAGIFAAAGGSLSDVVYMQVFLRTYADYADMNEVYREAFEAAGGPFPPRYCIRADLVKPDWLIEIAATGRVRRPHAD